MAEFAISGITLRTRLLSGRLHSAEALAIAGEVGRALAQAHSAGRVHGNLSTVSILLHGSSSSRITIQDFGGEGGETAVDPDCLAPERIASGRPTVASDIYSFGGILKQLRNASALDSTSGSRWDTAIHRCVDPVPERRFSSVDEVLQAIGIDERTLSIAHPSASVDARKKWGEFQLLQRLGVGGFGEVYRAWDLTLEREVALKLLRPRGLNEEEDFATIVSEARAMARVRHPNTVSVYGVDRHDGRVGLWGDFVRGQTLARCVETQGPLPEQEATQIAVKLCEALSAVHHAGLLHRDIKPSNAMRADDGRILLMDFGLSHELHLEPHWGGTLDYMAPELRAAGSPSVATDIYAMGVLLIFLCTGKHQLQTNDAPAHSSPTRAISPALKRVIDTATNADPQQRYGSAAVLRDALAATLPHTSPAVASKKKSPLLKLAWAASALLLLAAIAALIPQVRKEAQARFAGTNRAAYQDYQAGEDALARYDRPGNTQKAIDLFNRTLAESPGFALAEAGLARAAWRMYVDTSDKKWFDLASQAAASADTLAPNLAPVQMTVGMIHIEQGKMGLGTQELEQARQLDPRSADIRAALAEAYRVQRRLDDAKNELQTAIDLAPENWRWPYLLGALQLDSGDFKSAEANFKLALEKTPDNPRVLYNLGVTFRKQDKLEEASQAFRGALKQDSSYFQATMALAAVFTVRGQVDDALAMYKRSVEMRPADWTTWGNLATAEEFSGRDPEDAARNFHKAIDLALPQLKATPDSSFLVSRLGKFYASLHDSTHSLPLLRKSIVLSPGDPDVLERLAEAYELLGDRQQALTLLGKALQLGFSADYGKKTPVFNALRRDPRAPAQLRQAAVRQ